MLISDAYKTCFFSSAADTVSGAYGFTQRRLSVRPAVRQQFIQIATPPTVLN